MGKVVVGDPQDPDTDLGPLISFAHRDKVAGIVSRAPGQGGRIVAGGKAPDLPGAFYLPTLIADVAEDSEAYRDEIFSALVLTVRRHSGDDDALRQANDTDFGLAASAWTPRRLSGAAGVPGDQGGLRVDQRPHPDHQRDAARRTGRLRVRQGHVGLLVRGVPDHQARHERYQWCR